MRSFISAAVLVLTTASTAAAQARFTTVAGAPDAGFAPQSLLADFNNLATPTLAGIALSGNFSIQPGTVGGAAAPAGTTGFFAVPNTRSTTSTGTALISFSDYLGTQSFSSLSFYWGSIDTYNSLRLLDASGNAIAIDLGGGATTSSISGRDVATQLGMVAFPHGNRESSVSNRRIFFDLSSALTFRTLEITSNGRAFELDNIAGTLNSAGSGGTAVPEPTSFALVGAGLLGMVGVARRRRA